ncbi:MAG: glutaredoxin 3 [Hyphomicrobiaceae bacterium]|nr:glutaredoxin 3 [Hyphomicrobiaceae bacterium]
MPDVKARVEIYTTPTCPYCMAAKALLDEKQVRFEETSVLDPAVRSQMVQRARGGYTVPQIFINGAHIGGYDDMSALDRMGKLDPLLSQPAA